MHIVIIDGQGGRIGKALIESVKERYPAVTITAIGTNGAATAAMIKGGADEYATGENPVVTVARRADIIMGPIGILAADALLGEVTARMAVAISRSPAKKILIPVNKCDYLVAGVQSMNMDGLISAAVDLLAAYIVRK